MGMLEFTSAAGSDINARASGEFLAAIHSAQPGVPVLEIGDRNRSFVDVGHAALDAEAIRALSKRHQVDTLLVGEFDAQRVRPAIRFGTGVESMSAGADLSLVLENELPPRDTSLGAPRSRPCTIATTLTKRFVAAYATIGRNTASSPKFGPLPSVAIWCA